MPGARVPGVAVLRAAGAREWVWVCPTPPLSRYLGAASCVAGSLQSHSGFVQAA